LIAVSISPVSRALHERLVEQAVRPVGEDLVDGLHGERFGVRAWGM